MNGFLKYNWPSFLWAAFIFYLCMVPARTLPKINIPNIDKMVHFTFYLVLTALMFWGWKKQEAFTWLHRHSLLKIFVIACAYGLSIEVMQELFTADRHFEWLDEAANASGSFTTCLLIIVFKVKTS
jgi:VanZ family protein